MALYKGGVVPYMYRSLLKSEITKYMNFMKLHTGLHLLIYAFFPNHMKLSLLQFSY
jgi:hypothetical protein